MTILVLNVGSSSVKFQLLNLEPGAKFSGPVQRLAKGIFDRIGSEAVVALQKGDNPKSTSTEDIPDSTVALHRLNEWLRTNEDLAVPQAVGHRIVHGGERFHDAALIDDVVISGIEECSSLAPLHNPPALAGIRSAQEAFPVPQVAVFDTAFHQTIPESHFLYAIPYQLYQRFAIRRYGFHGTSHRYLLHHFAEKHAKKPAELNLITLHLGNGCSVTAIRKGKSLDTSMGLTPLEGLVMGTRSGDIDASVVGFVAKREGLSLEQIDHILNSESGLLGISGVTNDMRELSAAADNGNKQAELAIDMFCYRARKYIGAYWAALEGNVDAIVFAGGIGENAASIRARILNGLGKFGVILDPQVNEMMNGKDAVISTDGSMPPVHIIPTDEELMIAHDTARLVR
jgi:acetate kinase